MINKLRSVRDVYINAPKEYELVKEQYIKTNQEIQDIMHVLELGKLDAISLVSMAKELQKTRRRRRVLKDELEILEKVVNFTKQKPSKHGIGSLIGDIRSIEESRKRRFYKPRVRKDLQKYLGER